MNFTMNLKGQVNQMRLPKSKALWPLFETIVNSIQSLEETQDCTEPCITVLANRPVERQMKVDGEEELNHFEETMGKALLRETIGLSWRHIQHIRYKRAVRVSVDFYGLRHLA